MPASTPPDAPGGRDESQTPFKHTDVHESEQIPDVGKHQVPSRYSLNAHVHQGAFVQDRESLAIHLVLAEGRGVGRHIRTEILDPRDGLALTPVERALDGNGWTCQEGAHEEPEVSARHAVICLREKKETEAAVSYESSTKILPILMVLPLV